MTKILIYVLALAGVIGGAWWGVNAITGAFHDRTALQAQAEKDKRAIEDANIAADSARQDAIDAAHAADDERKLREDIARKANMRNKQTQQDLDHAKRKLEQWKRNASPELARCLDVVVPACAVSVQHSPEAIPVCAGGGQGGAAAATSAVHGPSRSARAARSSHRNAVDKPSGVQSSAANGQRATDRLVQVGR